MLSRRKFIGSLAAMPLGAAMMRGAEGAKPVTLENTAEFARHLEPVGRILEQDGWYVWCNTAIEDDAGRTHIYFSRWPAEKGMGGWINSCEIAHAVADRPEGPYSVTGPVLTPRGPGHWDATTCHNPHIQRIDGRYALFFMGNSNGRTNTKRVGLALADSPTGPWLRPDRPLLDVGPDGAWDDHCTTNPAFVRHPNGEYWLYYKSWNTAAYEKDPPPIRGNRMYGLAIADRLEGPYRKHPDNPLIDFSDRGANRQCEDAYIWREDDRFKILVRDMGVYDHDVGLIMESDDGLSWSEPLIAFREVSAYAEQPPQPKHLNRYGRLERPQLLLRDGRPAYLFTTTQGGRYETASGFLLRIV